MTQYPTYQPPILQPGPQPYSSPQGSYGQYPYGGLSSAQPGPHAVSSSMGSALVPSVPQSLPLPSMFEYLIWLSHPLTMF